MVEITNREELETWLKERPREDAILIASRAALRVFPALIHVSDEVDGSPDTTKVLSHFRAMFVSFIAGKMSSMTEWMEEVAKLAAAASSGAIESGSSNESIRGEAVAYAAANSAISVVAADDDDATDNSVHHASFAADWASDVARGIWLTVSTDVTALENGEQRSSVAETPLWSDFETSGLDYINEDWRELRDHPRSER